MKTYSTGMCSRLMFASSIVIKPEILIVDEILGVGDAYFAHKSFERMRKLCSQDGTTLLLVTHDIYSALNLCDRFIWIDRGEVKFDGDGKSAVALYESSVKEQEEQALRRKNTAGIASDAHTGLIHVLFRSPSGFALEAPLALESVTVSLVDGRSATLPVSKGAEGWTLLAEGNLGQVETIGGRRCRVLKTSGSIYHKAEWAVTLPGEGIMESVRVCWRYEGSDADRSARVHARTQAARRWHARRRGHLARTGVRPERLGFEGTRVGEADGLRNRQSPDHARGVSRRGWPRHRPGPAW